MLEWPEVIVIGTVALLFFGPKRLPEMARSIGQGIKEFRKATQESFQKAGFDCPSCHQAISDEHAKFCPGCGKTLTVPTS